MADTALFTVGHSNRSLEALCALLESARVEILVDVRAQPVSSRLPHFNRDALREAAEARGMTYHWAGRQLGGLRPSRPDSPHVALSIDGLRGYADYMDTEAFKQAVSQLVTLAQTGSTAMLCAERLPAHCHRSLIADYLLLDGHTVIHLLEQGDFREHQLRAEARRESVALVYDRNISGKLKF